MPSAHPLGATGTRRGAAPVPPAPEPDATPAARLAAAALDAAVLGAVLAVATVLGGAPDRPSLVGAVVAYHTALPWLGGATLGKAVLGLALRRRPGRRWVGTVRGLGWALARAVLAYPVALVADAPLALARRALRRPGPLAHDLAFGSRVVVDRSALPAGWGQRAGRLGTRVEEGAARLRPSHPAIGLLRWLMSVVSTVQVGVSLATRTLGWLTSDGAGGSAGRRTRDGATERRSAWRRARRRRAGAGRHGGGRAAPPGPGPSPAVTAGLVAAAALVVGVAAVVGRGAGTDGAAAPGPNPPGAVAPGDDPQGPTTSAGGTTPPRPGDPTTSVPGPRPPADDPGGASTTIAPGPGDTTDPPPEPEPEPEPDPPALSGLATDRAEYGVGDTVAASAAVSGAFDTCTWTIGGTTLDCSPASGAGAGPVTVTGAAVAEAAGTLDVSLAVTGPGGSDSGATAVTVAPVDATPPALSLEPSSVAPAGEPDLYHLSVTATADDPEAPVTRISVTAVLRWRCAGVEKATDLGYWLYQEAAAHWVGGDVWFDCPGDVPADDGSVRVDLHGVATSAGGTTVVDTVLAPATATPTARGPG